MPRTRHLKRRSHEQGARRGQLGLLFWYCAAITILSVLLGGATRQGYFADTILQLACLPLLVAALVQAWGRRDEPGMGPALLAAGAIAFVPLVQIFPLPAFLWSSLPGREQFARTLDMNGMEMPWLSISLWPALTLQSFLSLIPPLALFLGVLLLGRIERRMLSLGLVGLGLLSALVGMLQLSGGSHSPLRFFEETNRDSAVGFFANANHCASFLAVLIPLVGAWCIALASRRRKGPSGRQADSFALPALFGMVATGAFLLLAQNMTRSRGGIVLAALAAFGTLGLLLPYLKRMLRSRLSHRLYIAALVGCVVLGSLLVYRIVPSFNVEEVDASRYTITVNTLNAAWRYAPFGSGMGTFVPIYQMYEKPEEVTYAYVNRAHDDLAELLLESGVLGAVVLLGLVFWWLRNIFAAWRQPIPERDEIDHLLRLAATIMVPLPLLHSLIDYPLRTGTMMAMLAIASALLVPPPGRGRRSREAVVEEPPAPSTRTEPNLAMDAGGTGT